MKRILLFITLVGFLLLSVNCKQTSSTKPSTATTAIVRYAHGFSIQKQAQYTLLTIKNPWPNSTKTYTYVLAKRQAVIPDSLKIYPTIVVPVKKLVATSTTHLPSLDMLGESNALVGFPNLNYISSEKIRARIEKGKVTELGNNQNLNTEVVLNMRPDVIIGYGVDHKNSGLDFLEQAGLAVILNGDWNEQSPLGKAEWIKLFGVLFCKEAQAEKVFNQIEQSYLRTAELVKNVTHKPTVLAGAMYQDSWYLPEGNSWAAQFIATAGGDYLWKDTKGSGSLSLPFELVFEKAANASIWIGPGQFSSYHEMAQSSKHYTKFSAFQHKKIVTFSSKKGKTGGVIYYELAPNRPDLVLQDLVKILHPTLLPQHNLYFFEPLH